MVVEAAAAVIMVVHLAEEALRALNLSIPANPTPVETMADPIPTWSNCYVA